MHQISGNPNHLLDCTYNVQVVVAACNILIQYWKGGITEPTFLDMLSNTLSVMGVKRRSVLHIVQKARRLHAPDTRRCHENPT